MPRITRSTASAKKTSDDPPRETSHVRNTPKQQEAVRGARMARPRHSGLLARDEAESLELEGTSMGLSPSFEAVSSDVIDGDFPTITGREMYSFRGRGKRGRNVTKDPITPKNRKLDERKHDRLLTTTPAASSVETTHDDSSGDDLIQVGDRTPCRGDFSGSDDEDLSGVSDTEDLAAIAARLNQAEASEDMLDDYFTAHSGKTAPTSDHTLSRLACPRMDQQSMQSALKAAPSSFQLDCQVLYEEYRHLYPYWLFQMSNGYNVLLHGLGSKRKLIEDFQRIHLSESCHLVVNGYFPGLTVKQILLTLSSDVLGHSGTFRSLSDQAQFICSALEEQEDIPEELFVLIHNIDGPMLRGEKAQSALSILAQSPHLHLVGSVDHINAPLIWDQNKLSRFNWVWHDVTTYEPYQEETSFENSLLIQQTSNLALSSLTHVMKSLTPNAKGIFQLLARYQLEHKGEVEGGYLGLSFNECYMKCRERFLVNSDLTLRAQLTEFRDHKLIRSRKGNDGVEYLYIPLDDASLTQFLEQQNEQN